jgi:hypothetical protein
MNATTMYLEYVYFCVTVPDDVEIDEIDSPGRGFANETL